MLRRMAVLVDEPLNVLKSRDDAFFAGRSVPRGYRLNFNAKFSEKDIILVGKVSHG